MHDMVQEPITKEVKYRLLGVLACLPVLVTAVLLLSPAWMKGSDGAKESRAPAPKQSPLVSIKARDMEVSEVLRAFSDQVGAQLILDARVQGRISIEAKNSDLREVMENLCTALKCQWRLFDDHGLNLVVQPQR